MDTISVVDVAAAVEAEFDRLKVARPALCTRIGRAEDILVTHLSCKRAGIIKPRIRGGELVTYLVKGSGGAVYKVDPQSWQCSCPDAHRRGKGCKHSIACYALGRAFRPSKAPAHQEVGRRCGARPKITRHDVESDLLRDGGDGDFGHAGEVASRVLAGVVGEAAASEKTSSYEERACSRCLEGLVYDGQASEWVACERCEGTGRVMAFLYEHASRRLSECTGCGKRFPHRELIEVTEDHESLTHLPGDRLCVRDCAGPHGVL